MGACKTNLHFHDSKQMRHFQRLRKSIHPAVVQPNIAGSHRKLPAKLDEYCTNDIKVSGPISRASALTENKVGYTAGAVMRKLHTIHTKAAATKVACRWAGAVIKKAYEAFGQE